MKSQIWRFYCGFACATMLAFFCLYVAYMPPESVFRTLPNIAQLGITVLFFLILAAAILLFVAGHCEDEKKP